MNPIVVNRKTKDGLHGDDERISVEEYHNVIQVYVALIVNADQDLGKKDQHHLHRDL